MDEKYNKKASAAQKIHEKARQLRGRFLNSVAVIERDIAVILIEYFSSIFYLPCVDDRCGIVFRDCHEL